MNYDNTFEGAVSKTIKRLQIPSEVIVDREFSHDTFFLLVELKRLARNGVVNEYLAELKQQIGWAHNKKLRRHFDILYDYGLIRDKINGFAKYYEKMNIVLTTPKDSKHFTQVDVSTIKRIKECTKTVKIQGNKNILDVKHVALRLFYYYEKNYNYDLGKAYPSYQKITEDTKIHPTYIKAINEIFHEKGIVTVETGNTYFSGNMYATNRNQYIPHCNRAQMY